MVLKQVPKRIQIANEEVATYAVLSPTEVSLMGQSIGVTVLTLWFVDPVDPAKVETITYHVRVDPDPALKDQLERVYKALENEINCAFPNSHVCLALVGDKLVVSGQAHDIAEASKILQIVRDSSNRRNNRDPLPEAARIPTDTIRASNPADPLNPDGFASPGTEDFILQGSQNIINMLRVPGEQQVMLKVTVAEVNRSAARSIGLNWSLVNNQNSLIAASNVGTISTGGQTGTFGSLGGTGLFFLQNGGIGNIPGIPYGIGGFNNIPAFIDNGQIGLAISALRNLNYAKSLAEPNLVTMNGQTANFQAGGEFPVPIISGYTAAGLQGVSFVPYGVQVSFTPFITDKDRIRLNVSADVSTRDLSVGNTNIGGTSVPNLTTRNFQTTVELREGQTLAVAGLIQTNLGANAYRIPGLGDLPVIGRLAAFDQVQSGEQELMILITPMLVHPMECDQLPPLPGWDLYEPGDLEFYLHARLESRREYDYRSQARTDLDRMKSYRRCEQLYISGPSGYSTRP
jgi:pilus assembly protein CpaC